MTQELSAFILSWLRSAYEQDGATHEQIAARIGVSDEFVSMLLAGTKRPGIKTARGLAKHLGCSVRELQRRAENDYPAAHDTSERPIPRPSVPPPPSVRDPSLRTAIEFRRSAWLPETIARLVTISASWGDVRRGVGHWICDGDAIDQALRLTGWSERSA